MLVCLVRISQLEILFFLLKITTDICEHARGTVEVIGRCYLGVRVTVMVSVTF